MLAKESIRVFAPATVANVGCGFDIFGFALQEPGDEVVLEVVDEPGLSITQITGDDGRIPSEPEKNTAGLSLLSMMKALKVEFGLNMELHKKMDIGSGLGSSAASAVASVFALNAMLKNPLPNDALLEYAVEGEKLTSGQTVHLDNISAALLGGFVLVRSNDPMDIIPLPAPDNLFCTVIHPKIEIRTELSRKMLRTSLPLYKAVRQWGNVAGTVSALYTRNYDLLKRSFEDEIVVPERAVLIPFYYEMRDAAIKKDAIGFSISGSGPSVFALSNRRKNAQEIGNALSKILNNGEIAHDLYVSDINREGPRILEEKL